MFRIKSSSEKFDEENEKFREDSYNDINDKIISIEDMKLKLLIEQIILLRHIDWNLRIVEENTRQS